MVDDLVHVSTGCCRDRRPWLVAHTGQEVARKLNCRWFFSRLVAGFPDVPLAFRSRVERLAKHARTAGCNCVSDGMRRELGEPENALAL